MLRWIRWIAWRQNFQNPPSPSLRRDKKVAKEGQRREFEPSGVAPSYAATGGLLRFTKMENWGKNLQPLMNANEREFVSSARRSQGS